MVLSSPPTIEQLTELYHLLSAAYGSPFSDHKEDIQQAAWALRTPIKEGYTPELLLDKMRLLRRKAGGYTSKLSSLIADEFWKKELATPVHAQFYKPDEPVL